MVYESRRDGDNRGSGADSCASSTHSTTLNDCGANCGRTRFATSCRRRGNRISDSSLPFITGRAKNSLVDALIAAGVQGRAAVLRVTLYVGLSTRQVIDLLDQVRLTSTDADVAKTAARAVAAIRRGVVAVDAA